MYDTQIGKLRKVDSDNPGVVLPGVKVYDENLKTYEQEENEQYYDTSMCPHIDLTTVLIGQNFGNHDFSDEILRTGTYTLREILFSPDCSWVAVESEYRGPSEVVLIDLREYDK